MKNRPRGWPFKTKKEERAWSENHMPTVQMLIGYLQKLDSKALVCYFETNTGDWRPQSPRSLGWLV